MPLNKKQRLSEILLVYWSNVFISVAQVFFGISAGIFFVGEFDQNKIVVILSNIILAFVIWIFGWRMLLWKL